MEWTTGNASHDGDERGWFVGGFIDPAHPNHADEVEIKWSAHTAGDSRTVWGSSPRRSLTILVQGAMRLTFKDGEILLDQPSDYALWDAGVEHTWMAEKPTTIMTVRWFADSESS